MKIAEIYRSIQGEGALTGVESTFVRASGCNLRCWFCDTPFASWQPEGEDLSIEEIANQVAELGPRHVVLTGGEPMLFAELVPLSKLLRRQGWHITIETAGTLYLPVECDLMSISPKLASSAPPTDYDPRWSARHERTRHAPEVIQRLLAEYPCQVKFVVDQQQDLAEIDRWLQQFPELDRSRVWLMPQGTDMATLADHAAWLEPYCLEEGFHYCPRKQIEWFGLVRGT